MSKHTFLLVPAVALALVGACHDNPNYCAGRLNDNCANPDVDAPVVVTGCKADATKCKDTTPVCDMIADKCVACLGSNVEDMSCPATAPVCSNQACGVCTADAQCGSGVCQANGACADANDVAYVNGTTSTNTACTKTEPCTTVTKALATTKSIIRVTDGAVVTEANTTATTPALKISKNVTIIGGAGSTVKRDNFGPIVGIDGSSVVTLRGLTITGAGGGADGVGVQVLTGMPTVTIERCRIANNSGIGIDVRKGSLTLLTSSVASNTEGGVSITSTGFKLTNNIIVLNGGAGSFFGGVKIDQISSGTTLKEMSFNTIANNLGPTGIVTGVACSLVLTACTFSNNIVFDNVVSSGITQTTGNNCSYTYSDIGPGAVVGGTGNLSVGPQFVDVSGGNFHLMGTSPVKDKADPAATLATDIDGDARPQGAGKDQGADEFKQ